MFHQQMPHHPMPPRPRPEGGQDPSPNFLNEHDTFKTKKDDLLVIDSWTGGPNQASTTQVNLEICFPEAENILPWERKLPPRSFLTCFPGQYETIEFLFIHRNKMKNFTTDLQKTNRNRLVDGERPRQLIPMGGVSPHPKSGIGNSRLRLRFLNSLHRPRIVCLGDRLPMLTVEAAEVLTLTEVSFSPREGNFLPAQLISIFIFRSWKR